MDGRFKVLIRPFSLAIGLWVKTRGETDSCTQTFAKTSPYLGYELRPTVRYNVQRDSMESDNMSGEKVSCLLGRRKLGYGNKVGCFGKTIDNG